MNQFICSDRRLSQTQRQTSNDDRHQAAGYLHHHAAVHVDVVRGGLYPFLHSPRNTIINPKDFRAYFERVSLVNGWTTNDKKFQQLSIANC